MRNGWLRVAHAWPPHSDDGWRALIGRHASRVGCQGRRTSEAAGSLHAPIPEARVQPVRSARVASARAGRPLAFADAMAWGGPGRGADASTVLVGLASGIVHRDVEQSDRDGLRPSAPPDLPDANRATSRARCTRWPAGLWPNVEQARGLVAVCTGQGSECTGVPTVVRRPSAAPAPVGGPAMRPERRDASTRRAGAARGIGGRDVAAGKRREVTPMGPLQQGVRIIWGPLAAALHPSLEFFVNRSHGGLL
jgi:hypothetical protein